jgi:UDP-glucose 4-epimerase
MKVLVVGGAGYIGSHMVNMLVKSGHDVIVLDNLSTGFRASVKYGRLVVGRFSRYSPVRQIFFNKSLLMT